MHFLSCGAKSYCGKVRLRTLKLLPVSTEDNRKKKKKENYNTAYLKEWIDYCYP
jgi:hypothetical protein